MAHSNDTKSAVRASFIRERLPLKSAACKHNVSYGTARDWKKKAHTEGDCWDKARTASRLAKGGLGDITNQVIEDFVLLFQTTIDDLKKLDGDALKKAQAIALLSDSYVKTMKAAGGGNKKIAELAVAIRVMTELSAFIKDHHPGQLEIFAAIIEPFGKHLSQTFEK